MTERELKLKELDKLEEELFLLRMKDRWDSGDYRLFNELSDKISKLEKELK